jgi:hypothetical protein
VACSGEFIKRSGEDWRADRPHGCLDKGHDRSQRSMKCRTLEVKLGQADEVSCRLPNSEALNITMSMESVVKVKILSLAILSPDTPLFLVGVESSVILALINFARNGYCLVGISVMVFGVFYWAMWHIVFPQLGRCKLVRRGYKTARDGCCE